MTNITDITQMAHQLTRVKQQLIRAQRQLTSLQETLDSLPRSPHQTNLHPYDDPRGDFTGACFTEDR